MFERGFFGKLFDLDGDGKMNAFEMAADFALFNEIMKEDKSSDSDDFDDDFPGSPIVKGRVIPNNSDRAYAEDILNKNVQRVIKGK